MVEQRLALGLAVLPYHTLFQFRRCGGPAHECQVQARLDGRPQRHLLEGVRIPGTQGVDGGGVALVLADDIGVIRLLLAHQHPQLRDDLEVDGVLATPDALNILHVRLGPGAQLLDLAEGQAALLIKYQHGVFLGEHVDALEARADVVVSVYQKNHFHCDILSSLILSAFYSICQFSISVSPPARKRRQKEGG